MTIHCTKCKRTACSRCCTLWEKCMICDKWFCNEWVEIEATCTIKYGAYRKSIWMCDACWIANKSKTLEEVFEDE